MFELFGIPTQCRPVRTGVLALFATSSLLLSAAPATHAGRYHVYSCRTPSGEPAPVDGWVGTRSGSDTFVENTCDQPGGALLAALGDDATRTANTDVATWALTVPTPETLAAATLWRAGDADGGAAAGAAYEIWFAGPENVLTNPGDNFDACEGGSLCPSGEGFVGEPLAAGNRLAVPVGNLGGDLFANASCVGSSGYTCPEGKGDVNNYAAAVYLYAADLTLEQAGGPAVEDVRGELAESATASGTSSVTFAASDPGAGVYQVLVTVDGHEVQRSVPDEAGGRCHSVGQAGDGTAAFLYLQPCPASVSADVELDTTKLADGSHHLVVSVLDAAGGSAVVLDRTIAVSNAVSVLPPVSNPGLPGAGVLGAGAPGPANGANASSQVVLTVGWKGSSRTGLVCSYGRAQTVVGRLATLAGAPVAGAQIEVAGTPAVTGASSVAMGGARTGADGSFQLRLPARLSSRTLRFAYRTHLGDPAPAAERTLTLSVRAAIQLHVAPLIAAVGRTIRFRGRLLGGPVPRGGKQLILEARSPRGRWIQFKVVRTNSRGAFRAGYRFRFPGPARYQFRARSESEADYPFASGASRAIDVRER